MTPAHIKDGTLVDEVRQARSSRLLVDLNSRRVALESDELVKTTGEIPRRGALLGQAGQEPKPCSSSSRSCSTVSKPAVTFDRAKCLRQLRGGGFLREPHVLDRCRFALRSFAAPIRQANPMPRQAIRGHVPRAAEDDSFMR